MHGHHILTKTKNRRLVDAIDMMHARRNASGGNKVAEAKPRAALAVTVLPAYQADEPFKVQDARETKTRFVAVERAFISHEKQIHATDTIQSSARAGS